MPGLSQQEMEAVASRIDTDATPVTVMAYGALPEEIREEAERQGYPAEDVRAVYHHGTVLLTDPSLVISN